MKAIAGMRILGLTLLVWAFALDASAQATAAAPAPAAAAPAATEGAFTAAQLEQMVAPIALYPDSLVTQMLMASTYPLEVVEAARWVKANPSLKDKELEEALKDQDWDVAVKAMCGIPDALQRMNENLDWTQDLGDAFLAQRTELLDAVQRMRGKAYEAGSLKTTEQQTVTQQPDKIIVIEQADPQVVYVPTYSPTVVYGTWSYPSYYYPAMYVPPPYGYGAMAFTAGVFWGAALSGGCNWGWGGSDVDIDINQNNNFTRNTSRNTDRTKVSDREGNRAGDRGGDRAGDKSGGKGKFQHNPAHRGGVNYRDNKTAQQFGGQGASNRVTKDQARGYDRSGASAKGTGQRGSPSASNRATGAAGSRQTGAAQRPSAGASQRAAGSGGASGQRAASSSQRPNASARSSASSSRNSAYSGSRNSGFDRSSSTRGSTSRSGGYSGGGGGGGRGGGGGGRGGGGGGGRRR